jgi:hypothetical protein
VYSKRFRRGAEDKSSKYPGNFVAFGLALGSTVLIGRMIWHPDDCKWRETEDCRRPIADMKYDLGDILMPL